MTVLRISGDAAGHMLDGLVRRRPAARIASIRVLRFGGDVLDRALVLWLPGPTSYTGQDCVELHLHGGRAVLAGVSDALVALGARPAEPGEFTRRAFLNGRMDLLEAEGVADLVEAETLAQRRQALRQMEGGLGTIYRGWAARLTRLLAQQEALIDFPDEDLPPAVEQAATAEILALSEEIGRHLDDGRRGERLREGLVFAIAGPPNAGKSTLINALAQRDVAIVSHHPGTTRDVLQVRVDLGGIPVTLLDTAGLRLAADEIEAEGVRRARMSMATADMIILARDPTSAPLPETDLPVGVPVFRLATKLDLATSGAVDGLAVSGLTGEGMDRLLVALTEAARHMTDSVGAPSLTRPRHRAALMEAHVRLVAAAEALWPELRAEDLRLAVRAVGRITGAVGVEDVLDSIFRQFCIGK